VARIIVSGLVVAAVIAVTQIRVNRSEGNAEATAIGTLRAISSAQAAYVGLYGGYARSLRVLSAPCAGSSAGMVSPDLGNDPTVKNGYEIRLRVMPPFESDRRDCNGQPIASTYVATAVPVERHQGATNAFAVDQTQVIWSDDTGVAPTPPFHETRTLRQLGSASPRR
jgi:hypothetical protein